MVSEPDPSDKRRAEIIASDPRLAAIVAESDTLAADLETFLIFASAVVEWAAQHVAQNVPPAGDTALKAIRKNREGASRFLGRWGVNPRRLIDWTLAPRVEGVLALLADLEQARLKHELAREQFVQRTRIAQAEFQQEIEREKRQEAPPAGDGQVIALDEEAICILCALASTPSVKQNQTDIEAAATVSRKTISNRLKSLEAWRLVMREGRSYLISAEGLAKLGQITLSAEARRVLQGTNQGQALLAKWDAG